MNVTIQKLNGMWHLIVGSCQIRTPFLETSGPGVGRCVRPAGLPWRQGLRTRLILEVAPVRYVPNFGRLDLSVISSRP